MYVQMHVHKIFLLRIAEIRITIKAVCVSSSKLQFNEYTGICQFFTRQKFPNPGSSIFSTITILRHMVLNNSLTYCYPLPIYYHVRMNVCMHVCMYVYMYITLYVQ